MRQDLKLREADEYQTNYMWEEYELTPHAAAELRNDAYDVGKVESSEKTRRESEKESQFFFLFF